MSTGNSLEVATSSLFCLKKKHSRRATYAKSRQFEIIVNGEKKRNLINTKMSH